MYIDKYTAQIKDIHTKKTRKVVIDANTAVEAHYKAQSFCNQLTQDIQKITDYEKNIVFTLEDGFKE